jgi:sarcosine oxidase subunit alpha
VERVNLLVNGKPLSVPAGLTLAVALAKAGIKGFRRSVRGQARGPVCGMGTCFECRVTVNGRGHCRSYLTPCQNGMEVWMDA